MEQSEDIVASLKHYTDRVLFLIEKTGAEFKR